MDHKHDIQDGFEDNSFADNKYPFKHELGLGLGADSGSQTESGISFNEHDSFNKSGGLGASHNSMNSGLGDSMVASPEQTPIRTPAPGRSSSILRNRSSPYGSPYPNINTSSMRRRKAKVSDNKIEDRRNALSTAHQVNDRESKQSCTVTVFGFPPNKAHAVIAHFESLGDIVKRNDSASNWIDIQYTSPHVVEAALEKNGEVIDGVMIGVRRQRGPSNISKRPQPRRRPKHPTSNQFEEFSFKRLFSFMDWSYDGQDERYDSAAIPQSTCSKIMEYVFQW
mmetsp:Transcript_22328/g.35998  ORF Transcript_22328/g.35998 Transcript_22328/m.35998 type:complete len:281 (+) Transcript_22328:169-1011(+)